MEGNWFFVEDFIEQTHQFGIKDKGRISNLRDYVKARASHSNWEVICMRC